MIQNIITVVVPSLKYFFCLSNRVLSLYAKEMHFYILVPILLHSINKLAVCCVLFILGLYQINIILNRVIVMDKIVLIL